MKIRKHINVLIIMLLCSQFKAQVNLVPNSSFEDTVGSVNCQSTMLLNKTKYWFNPSNTTPDYINICANTFTVNYPAYATFPLTCYGHQEPHAGNSMVGLATYVVSSVSDSTNYFSEYASVKLRDTLKSGISYYAEFHTILADICEIYSNRLSMYLSVNAFTTSNGSFTNTITPQVEFDSTQYFNDTLSWTKISNTFLAQGGETHLTIGSFKDGTHIKYIPALTSFSTQCNIVGTRKVTYVYIDDVSLEKLESALAGNDTTLNCGDSTRIGKSTSAISGYTWSPAAGLSNVHVAQPMANPTVTTTYTLTKQQGTTTTSDAVVVNVTNVNCDVGIKELYQNSKIKIYPNPVNHELNIEMTLNESQKATITIHNILGEILHTQTLQNGLNTIDTLSLANGTYFYNISIDGKRSKNDKIIIMK